MVYACPRCTRNTKGSHCTSRYCNWFDCYNCNVIFDKNNRFYFKKKSV